MSIPVNCFVHYLNKVVFNFSDVKTDTFNICSFFELVLVKTSLNLKNRLPVPRPVDGLAGLRYDIICYVFESATPGRN